MVSWWCGGMRRHPPSRRSTTMTVFLIAVAALSVSAIAGTVVVTARDGYRAVPTRTHRSHV
ncbi:hypothetical protein GW572_05915 [Clavibacter capsici]|nr:hypothetical protein GW572_05915 [Clavibacter capsici]